MTTQKTVQFKSKYLAGRKVYRVPIVHYTNRYGGSGTTLRGAEQQGGSLFYDREDTGLLVVTADGYLKNRSYAEFVGIAEYSPDGLSH